ncbi:MAG: hypothetical protein PHC94_06460 [Methylobacter sp.]|nr:hypothetical protein [Methylobacter sp.]
MNAAFELQPAADVSPASLLVTHGSRKRDVLDRVIEMEDGFCHPRNR